MHIVKIPQPTTVKIELTGADIVELLRCKGMNIRADARVYFDVPRGGDYSGMRLELDEHLVTVEGETHATES